MPDLRGALTGDVKGVRIGVPRAFLGEGVDRRRPRRRSSRRCATLAARGATLVDIELPHAAYGIPVYYLICTAEASSNLARYDGVRYGYRTQARERTTALLQMYERTRDEGFGPEVKRRIMLGTYVLSAGYYDAYYLKAQQVRTLLRQDYERAFERVDVVATPTTPTPAFKLGEKTSDPVQMYLNDIFTVSANLTGLPAISVPCGFSPDGEAADRLPADRPRVRRSHAAARRRRVSARHTFHTEAPPTRSTDGDRLRAVRRVCRVLPGDQSGGAVHHAGLDSLPRSVRRSFRSAIPFFLKIVGARGAIVAQPILFGARSRFSAREIVRADPQHLARGRRRRRLRWSLPQIREFHASILSESLFLSLLVVVPRAQRSASRYHPTWHLMVLVAIDRRPQRGTVRRTASPCVPVMLVMVLLQRQRLHRLAGARCSSSRPSRRSSRDRRRRAGHRADRARTGTSSSLMGRHMFAKAALIDAPPGAAAQTIRCAPRSIGICENDYAPIRAFLASAPPRSPRRAVDLLRDLPAGRLRRSIARADAGPRTKPDRPRCSARRRLARIRRAPLAFLDAHWQ